MDQIPLTGRAQSAIDSNSSSIGIATKKYWTKLLQLHSSYQQLQSDVSRTFKLTCCSVQF